MVWLIKFAVYALAAAALYIQWPTQHRALWWAILVSAILSAWTAETVRTAFRDTAAEDPSLASNPGATAYLPDDASRVIRFWVWANMAVTGITLALAIWGLLA